MKTDAALYVVQSSSWEVTVVSVIIPVYNAEKTIEKCVDSLAYGLYRNIEIILVDDCSTDKSWKKCSLLAEKYPVVKCFKNKINSGVSITRNNGIEHAKGDYICFVDSDDWVSGKYLQQLLYAQESYPNALPICGIRFMDYQVGLSHDYIWENNATHLFEVEKEHYFDLLDRFYLQAPYNKLFLNRLIQQYHIRFDPNQKMGEDFQFVLDYLQQTKCSKCIVINQPLYYYIRYSNKSLMGDFGIIENENGYRRLEQLLKICGDSDPQILDKYRQECQNQTDNYIYHITRNKNISRQKKTLCISELVGEKYAKKRFAMEQFRFLKEKIFQKVKLFPRKCLYWAKGRLQSQINKCIIKKMSKELKCDEFTIISQNCIGGVFYHDMGMQFLSPTINLYFDCSDFVRFVKKLDYYLGLELEMEWGEEFPVGHLGDVKIYFMHYNTCTEARETWERRCKRIQRDRILVLCTDMENFTDETFAEFKKIEYPKILFTAHNYQDSSVIYFPQYADRGKISDLIPKRKFYRNGTLIEIINKFYGENSRGLKK